jgi:hypothetical protein
MNSLRSYTTDLIGEKLGGVDPALESLGKKGISVRRFLKLKWRALQNDPQDDNIFTPHPEDYVDYGIFDYTGKITKKEITYHLFHTTIWDVFQEMTHRHPGWIASPVPYGDRMTMFFGVPSQRYWSRPASATFIEHVAKLRRELEKDQQFDMPHNPRTVSEYVRAIKMRFRPFRQYHLFTSYTDIVSNNISVSSYGVSNMVAVEFNAKGFEKANDDTAKVGNTEVGVRDDAKEYVESLDKKTFILKYHPHMGDDDAHMKTMRFENCNGQEMALRYALKGLCDGVKEMYKGTLTILGNAEIKPYDVGILLDTYNGMSGPFEIEEITHFFSAQTGWISVLVPKALVFANEISSSPLIDAITWGAVKKGQEFFHSMGELVTKVEENYDIDPTTLGLAGIAAVRSGPTGAAIAGSFAAGFAIGAGLNVAVGGLVAGYRYVAYDETPVFNKTTQEWETQTIKAPITLVPLMMHGYPLVAGIPTGAMETRWQAFKGRWTRTLDSVESGFHEALMAANTMGFNIVNAYGPDMSLVEKGAMYVSK